MKYLSNIASTVAALGIALALGAAAAGPVTLPHSTIREKALPNGLRILMIENHDAPVINVQVWYHVGSKNELAGKTGFAHLFEHLMFDGTKNIGPDQFSDYVVRSGGTDNAYTTEDATIFWETIPSNNLPAVLWLEADRMRNLQITERVFKTEREVVKEERRQRLDNQPYGTVVEVLYQNAFKVHPYQHQTIGSMEDLDRASIDDIRQFYDTNYVPSNATLVMVGDFEPVEAEALAEKYFGPLPASPPPPRVIPQEPVQTSKRVLKIVRDVALPAFVEGYHMPADGTPDAYPLRLASEILSEGDSSRIRRRLVYEKQVALDAQSAGNFTEDPNLFFVLGVMNATHTPEEGEREVDDEIARLRNEPVSAYELETAKNQILREFILSRETTKSRADELGYDAEILKDPELVNTELARFLAVTAEDIQRVARRYFVPENMTVVEVSPETGKAGSGE
ncbi:MAG: pitrilysin family protein [Terriglobia bacterium]